MAGKPVLGACRAGEEVLNTAGLTTGVGKPFTPVASPESVTPTRSSAPRTVAVQYGEVSVKHAAVQLGILADAVYSWLQLGQVPARRGPSAELVVVSA